MNQNLGPQFDGMRPVAEVRGYEFGDAPDWSTLEATHGARASRLDVSEGVHENLWVDDTRTPPLLHDGHARLLAAHRAGHTHVPVRSYSLEDMESDFY